MPEALKTGTSRAKVRAGRISNKELIPGHQICAGHPAAPSRLNFKEPHPMNRTSLVICLAASMAATVGCASKNYVKQQTTPLINKTNELDDLAAKNSKDIKDVDARAQAGIQEVQTKAAAVDQKAQAAGQQADQAQTLATNAVHRVDTLQN